MIKQQLTLWLSLIVRVYGSECDDAVFVYRSIKVIDVVYKPNSDTDCCFIYPVVCSRSDDGVLLNPPQITELKWGSNGLSGNIPDAIGKLSHLKIINISNNAISGYLPKSILNLSRLEKLIIYETQLNTTDIEWIKSMKNLELVTNKPDPSIDFFKSPAWISGIVLLIIAMFLLVLYIIPRCVRIFRHKNDQTSLSTRHSEEQTQGREASSRWNSVNTSKIGMTSSFGSASSSLFKWDMSVARENFRTAFYRNSSDTIRSKSLNSTS